MGRDFLRRKSVNEEKGETPRSPEWTSEAKPSEGATASGARRLGDVVARARGARSRPRRRAPRSFTPEQRLVLLDVWQRSDLPASDFSELAGVSPHSLYTWKKKFDAEGLGAS